MTPSEADRIVDALAELSPAERERWFEEHDTPAALRGQVRRVLADMDALLAAPDALPTPGALARELASDGALADVPAEAALPETIGPYTVHALLGAGGMGVVYRAEQQEPRRDVAVKVMHRSVLTAAGVRRFEREAQLLGRLQHPGIAQIHELGRTADGATYLVMEFVDGLRLTDHAARAGLDQRARVDLLVDLAEAVHHAHLRSVLHRDLKPGNVLVTEEGQVKVIDFGVARALDDEDGATLETSAGQIVGTLTYMSPEQLRGEVADIDARADVYALGVLAYELLGGRLPHDLETATLGQALHIVCEQDPPPLGRVEPACRGDLEHIVGKALEKEPQRRYQSAAAFAADLRRHLADQPVEARPASTVYQMRKFARRNRGLVAGVLVALVAIVGGAAVAVDQALENKALAHEEAEARREADLAAAAAARSAEAASRNAQRAEEEARRAEEARAAEAQRAAELAVLVDFQESELDAIHAESMGDTIRSATLTDLERRWTNVERLPPADVEARLAQLGGWLAAADLTSVARRALRDTLLETSHDKIRKRLADQPGPQGRLLTRLGLSYALLDFPEDALATYEEAVSTLERALGPNAEETLNARLRLAGQLADVGRHAEAARLYEALHPALLRLLGPAHDDTLESVLGLAAQASRGGDIERSLQLQRQALADAEAVPGRPSRLVPVIQANLARYLVNRNEHVEAEALQRAALAHYVAQGDEHRPPAAKVAADLAVTLQETGRSDEALPLMEKAVEHLSRFSGRKDPTTVEMIHRLGVVHFLRGEFERARPYMAESVATQREAAGSGSLDFQRFHAFVGSLADYAECLRKLDELDTCRPLMLEARKLSLRMPEGTWLRHEVGVRLRRLFEDLDRREPGAGWIDRADAEGLPQASLDS